MARTIIFADLHFGDQDCSLTTPGVETGVRPFLSDLGTVGELILAGDILDADIFSLKRAIEGRRSSGGVADQIKICHCFARLFRGNGIDANWLLPISLGTKITLPPEILAANTRSAG